MTVVSPSQIGAPGVGVADSGSPLSGVLEPDGIFDSLIFGIIISAMHGLEIKIDYLRELTSFFVLTKCGCLICRWAL